MGFFIGCYNCGERIDVDSYSRFDTGCAPNPGECPVCGIVYWWEDINGLWYPCYEERKFMEDVIKDWDDKKISQLRRKLESDLFD